MKKSCLFSKMVIGVISEVATSNVSISRIITIILLCGSFLALSGSLVFLIIDDYIKIFDMDSDIPYAYLMRTGIIVCTFNICKLFLLNLIGFKLHLCDREEPEEKYAGNMTSQCPVCGHTCKRPATPAEGEKSDPDVKTDSADDNKSSESLKTEQRKQYFSEPRSGCSRDSELQEYSETNQQKIHFQDVEYSQDSQEKRDPESDNVTVSHPMSPSTKRQLPRYYSSISSENEPRIKKFLTCTTESHELTKEPEPSTAPFPVMLESAIILPQDTKMQSRSELKPRARKKPKKRPPIRHTSLP